MKLHNFRVEDTQIESGEQRMTIDQYERRDQETKEEIELKFVQLCELFRDIENIGNELVKKHPLIAGNEELQLLFETGILYFKNFERLLRPITTDSFAVCIPFVHCEEIQSFEELEFLVLKIIPKILLRDDYKSLMKNAFDHFRLLEVLSTIVTREQVERAAKKLGIEKENAAEWIFAKLPILYSLIECNLPKLESNLVIRSIRKYLKEQRIFIQGGHTN